MDLEIYEDRNEFEIDEKASLIGVKMFDNIFYCSFKILLYLFGGGDTFLTDRNVARFLSLLAT